MSNHEMEKMLSQLIRMVGTIQASQEEMIQSQQRMEARLDGVETRLDKVEARLDGMEARLDRVEARLDGMETRLEQMEVKAELRHQETFSHIEKLERDQDFIWEKAARNEREIGNIKRQLT